MIIEAFLLYKTEFMRALFHLKYLCQIISPILGKTVAIQVKRGMPMPALIELMNAIEKLRLELYDVAQGKSLTDPEVIQASQKLDLLLVEYQKMIAKKIPQWDKS